MYSVPPKGISDRALGMNLCSNLALCGAFPGLCAILLKRGARRDPINLVIVGAMIPRIGNNCLLGLSWGSKRSVLFM